MNAMILLSAIAGIVHSQSVLENALEAKIQKFLSPASLGSLRRSNSWGRYFRLDPQGSCIWQTGEGGDLLVWNINDLKPSRFSFRFVLKRDDARRALQKTDWPIVETGQWQFVDTAPEFTTQHGFAASARAPICCTLDAQSEAVGTILYDNSYASRLRGDGVASVDLRKSESLRNRTIVETEGANSIVAAACDRNRRGYAYLKLKNSRGLLAEKLLRRDKASLQVLGKKLLRGLPSPIEAVPMVFDDALGLVIYGSARPELCLVNTRTGTHRVFRLPNAGASPMNAAKLAWEKSGTVLVGVRKTMKWNNGRDYYTVPKLYRFDPATGKFTYLGCCYLLGSSLRGEWLLIGDGPRLERVYLMKGN